VDCTGRCIREDKAGYIEQHHSPILARLGLDSEQWLTLTTEFEQHFSTAVGSEHMLQQFKHHTDHQRIRGMAKRLGSYFNTPEQFSITHIQSYLHNLCSMALPEI
jgi:hypothetical protein